MGFESEGASEGYQAIGRWIVQFSRLIGGMRTNMQNRLIKPDDDQMLVGLALGAAPAAQIADSFFSMCRLIGNLTDAETNIANQLQNEVGKAITTRNAITHGDWIIGGSDEGETRAHLVRVYPNRRQPPFHEVKAYTKADFDKLSDRLGVLGGLVWPFGLLALGLPFLTKDHGMSEPGEYRVSDVLIAQNVPKSGKGGQVVLGGPKASSIII